MASPVVPLSGHWVSRPSVFIWPLQKVAPAATEDEHVTGIRVLGQNLFGLRRKRVEATPHVRHARGQPDPRVASPDNSRGLGHFL